MLNRALDKAKKEGGKKVPINFQVPSDLKEQFENLCKKNEVSVTSMLTALMETALDEAKGIYYELDANSLLSINHRIIEIEKELDSVYRHYGLDENDIIVGLAHSPEHYLEYMSWKNELNRLTKIFEMYEGKEDDSNN